MSSEEKGSLDYKIAERDQVKFVVLYAFYMTLCEVLSEKRRHES